MITDMSGNAIRILNEDWHGPVCWCASNQPMWSARGILHWATSSSVFWCACALAIVKAPSREWRGFLALNCLSKANGTVVKFVSDKLQWSLYNDTRRWDGIGRVPFLYVIDTTIQPHRSSSIASPNQTDHTLLGSDSLRYHPIGGNSLHKLNYYTTRQYVTQDARTYII